MSSRLTCAIYHGGTTPRKGSISAKKGFVVVLTENLALESINHGRVARSKVCFSRDYVTRNSA